MKVLLFILSLALIVFSKSPVKPDMLPIRVDAFQTDQPLNKDTQLEIKTNQPTEEVELITDTDPEGLEYEPIPFQFWVFLGMFTAIIFVIVRKNKNDAANRTVVARRADLNAPTNQANPANLAAQIDYHESEIHRLTSLLEYHKTTQQISQPMNHYEYPAQYAHSVHIEMAEHPRYM